LVPAFEAGPSIVAEPAFRGELLLGQEEILMQKREERNCSLAVKAGIGYGRVPEARAFVHMDAPGREIRERARNEIFFRGDFAVPHVNGAPALGKLPVVLDIGGEKLRAESGMKIVVQKAVPAEEVALDAGIVVHQERDIQFGKGQGIECAEPPQRHKVERGKAAKGGEQMPDRPEREVRGRKERRRIKKAAPVAEGKGKVRPINVHELKRWKESILGRGRAKLDWGRKGKEEKKAGEEEKAKKTKQKKAKGEAGRPPQENVSKKPRGRKQGKEKERFMEQKKENRKRKGAGKQKGKKAGKAAVAGKKGKSVQNREKKKREKRMAVRKGRAAVAKKVGRKKKAKRASAAKSKIRKKLLMEEKGKKKTRKGRRRR
jgi:hypothetical protein